MPQNSFYRDHGYPTYFDVNFDATPIGRQALAVIDELRGGSTILNDAAITEATGQNEHVVKRERELPPEGMMAAKDEGYSYTDTTYREEVKFRLGRAINAKQFTDLDARYSREAMLEFRTRQFTECAVGLRQTMENQLIGGGVTYTGPKAIDGMLSYVDALTNMPEFKDRFYNKKVPFTTKNGLVLDNQLGSGTAGTDYASVLGVIWGTDKASILYPNQAGAPMTYGFSSTFHQDEKLDYVDPVDGKTKTFRGNEYTMETFFGFGLMNRYALSRIANINMAATGEAMANEMGKLYDNINELHLWLTQGGALNGSGLTLYAPMEVIVQFKKYYASLVQPVATAPASNSGIPYGLGQYQVVLPSGVVIKPEFTLRPNESLLA